MDDWTLYAGDEILYIVAFISFLNHSLSHLIAHRSIKAVLLKKWTAFKVVKYDIFEIYYIYKSICHGNIYIQQNVWNVLTFIFEMFRLVSIGENKNCMLYLVHDYRGAH